MAKTNKRRKRFSGENIRTKKRGEHWVAPKYQKAPVKTKKKHGAKHRKPTKQSGGMKWTIHHLQLGVRIAELGELVGLCMCARGTPKSVASLSATTPTTVRRD